MEEKTNLLYQSVIMKHYRDPKYRRTLSPPAIETNMVSRSCGDKVKLYLLFDEAGRIRDASYQGEGCSISIASASILCSAVIGLKDTEAKELAAAVIEWLEDDNETGDRIESNRLAPDILSLQSVRSFGTRIPCATLAWKSLASVAIL